MNPALLVLITLCVAVAAAFVVVFRKLWLADYSQPVTARWIMDFSSDVYRPLERLLDEEDFRFLLSHRGFSRRTVAALRAERRRIFRRYLRNLRRDFSRVCSAIHMLMLHSPQDRGDLASLLVKQKAVFALALAAVQFRLLLHAWGLARVDVRGLVSALEKMRVEMLRLVSAAQAGPAQVSA